MESNQTSNLPPGEPSPGGEWHRPLPERLPKPVWWPAAFAFAVTLIFWGPVTSLWISGVGAVVGAFALRGWIGELRK